MLRKLGGINNQANSPHISPNQRPLNPSGFPVSTGSSSFQQSNARYNSTCESNTRPSRYGTETSALSSLYDSTVVPRHLSHRPQLPDTSISIKSEVEVVKDVSPPYIRLNIAVVHFIINRK